MSLTEFLCRVLDILEAADTPYMLTGSLAASFHGAPRATQDVDVVIETDEPGLAPLTSGFQAAGLHVSEAAAREAVRSRGQFNVIESQTGWKADLIVRKDRPFSRQEFDRRSEVEALGRTLCMVTAEDLIIAKLEWAKLGESERQLKDVAGILELQGRQLDHGYLMHWIQTMHLEDRWEDVKKRLGPDPFGGTV